MELLLELAETEHYDEFPEEFPPITHMKVASFAWEVGAPGDMKPPRLTVWFSKGFLKDGQFRAAPGYPGVELLLTEESDLDLVLLGLVENLTLKASILRTVYGYAIEFIPIAGTIVEV